MAYTDAIYDGTINDNYNYLVKEKPFKSRFINYHLPKLREYASRCESITEFGVDAVNSTWALLDGKPERMVSIDPMNEKAPKIQDLALELAKKEGIDYKFIQKYSTDIKIEETDLLFIDSGHNYKCLSTELNMHADKVKKYIIFHDMNMPELKKAIADVLGLSEISNSSFMDSFSGEQKDWELIYKTQESEGFWVIKRKGIKE